ncbi:MAG: hypothetical protein KJ723_02375 [candidate division Zixibacteria bacterium]|nr:hypothetical protein [candidate division Zixibacteria bacterium]
MSKVFFPLRSNVEYFQNPDLRNSILDRLKHSILLYDEIVIEDGTYVAEITESGSYCPYFPPGTLPEHERLIVHERDIEPGRMQVGIQVKGQNEIATIMDGNTIARYKIDFHEFMKQVDLESCDFIRLVSVDKDRFPKQAQKAIKDSSRRDKYALTKIHQSTYLRNVYIENLNHDIVLSMLLNAAVVLDRKHSDVLRMKCANDKDLQAHQNPEEIALRQLLSIVVPDLRNHSIMDVLDLRKKQQWCDFRGFISDIVAEIAKEPQLLLAPSRVHNLISQRISKALFDKLKNKVRTGTQLLVDVGFGVTSLIPGFGAIPAVVSTLKSGEEYISDKSGWLAFLLKIDAGSE